MFRFKGEKVKQKSKREHKVKKEATGLVTTWSLLQSHHLPLGPLTIQDSKHDYMNAVGGTRFVSFKAITIEVLETEETDTQADLPVVDIALKDEDLGPRVGSQVFIVNKQGDKFTLKSCYDKYLSVDKKGTVSCDMEAAGPAECWTLVQNGEEWGLKSYFNMYLTTNTNEGSVRADSVELKGFKLMMQVKSGKEKVEKISLADEETQSIKLSHSNGLKRKLNQDVEQLLKGKKDGNLAKVLLERRTFAKRDKMC